MTDGVFVCHMCWLLSTSTPRANCKNCHPAIPRWKVLIVRYRSFLGDTNPNFTASFLVGKSIQNDAKARFCLHQSWIPPQIKWEVIQWPLSWLLAVCDVHTVRVYLMKSHRSTHWRRKERCHQILRMENPKDVTSGISWGYKRYIFVRLWCWLVILEPPQQSPSEISSSAILFYNHSTSARNDGLK